MGNFSHHMCSFVRIDLFSGAMSSLNPSVLGGHNIANCPSPDSTIFNGSLYNPTTSVLSLLASILCLSFALVTIWAYNSVRVFNRKIRTENISNKEWIVFFVFAAVQ